MPSAAILAGGCARRFEGRDKSALLVEGRTILERQLDALGPLTTDILIVGRDVGGLQTAARRLRVIADRLPDRGPLGGLDAALTEAAEPVVVVLACDMPFVTTRLLEHLVAAAGDADAAVPRDARGDHPLCAAYTRRCRDAVRRHLAQGRFAVKDLLPALRVHTVTEAELRLFGDPHRLLANINTPDQYASLAAPHADHSR